MFKKTITFLYCLLFFLTPLIFSPYNSELFEFNKMILVYGLTVLITGAWLGQMLLWGRILFRRTPLDIPLVLFLISQFAATLLSIDSHTSLFGYYSRFNGGLLSTISYCLLYWAFVNTLDKQAVFKILKISLITGAMVAVYGILEHFGHSFSCILFGSGFNTTCWIQDVKTRVFATLGQPNWLAAYLAILIPITLAFIVNRKTQRTNICYLLFTIYYLCLVFTGSRSGFLGLIVGLITFWALTFWQNTKQIGTLLKPFIFFIFSTLFFIFIFGSPLPQLNRFTYYKNLISHFSPPTQLPPPTPTQITGTQLEVGGTESGKIRKIVWQGALAIFKHYPILGSGPETFAYSYYNFRPIEHNLVSEWDFLYNKAHNEYLNYLATTGIVGFGSYLSFGIAFVIWTVSKLKAQKAKGKTVLQNLKVNNEKFLDLNFSFESCVLTLALFTGWLSILVSNFFGFSVVVVSLYFYLIPAFCFVLFQNPSPQPTASPKTLTSSFKMVLGLLLFAICYLLFAILNLWRADYFYATGQKLAKQNQYTQAYDFFNQAIALRPNEPVYLNETASAIAGLAYLSGKQNEAATELAQAASYYSDKAIAISPRNLSLLKNRVRVFYTLSTLDPAYLTRAIDTIKTALTLAPTDPKLFYNLGLLYGKAENVAAALSALDQALDLKPNYEEARNALAIFYEDLGEKNKAIEQLEIILKNKPFDESVRERIERLKQ